MKICVVGGGPGALAIASRIASAAYWVGLCELPRFQENISEIQQSRKIQARGVLSGQFTLSLVTTDPREALKWADIIVMVTHAAAHGEFAELCAPFITEKHAVILCPSYVGGALDFRQTVKGLGYPDPAGLVECSVLPYVCNKPEPDTVYIKGVKRRFIVSCDDGPQALRGAELIQALFDRVDIHHHPVQAGLNETNFIIHACVALLNIGFVEGGNAWTFYRQGLTPRIGGMIEAVDRERLMLMAALDLPQTTLAQWMREFYAEQGMAGEGIYELLGTFPPFERSPGPQSFAHRYFSEDIGYGLVPMAELAARYDVAMPLTNALIDLACQITGEDYRRTGRSLKSYESQQRGAVRAP